MSNILVSHQKAKAAVWKAAQPIMAGSGHMVHVNQWMRQAQALSAAGSSG
jgi:hypothetical protein